MRLFQQEPRLSQAEIAFLAKDVDVVCEPLLGYRRQDLPHHVFGIGHGI